MRTVAIEEHFTAPDLVRRIDPAAIKSRGYRPRKAPPDGPSPMELVLMGRCSCTAVDVVSILHKKREAFTSLTVSADAERAPNAPSVFTHIHLTYHLGGKVSPKAAEDAVALSKNKYCSVSKMLEKAVAIDYEITYEEA